MTTKSIDPKYTIEVREEWAEATPVTPPVPSRRIEIVNLSGVPIPEDEPMILFRARDYLALPMLEHYAKLALADGCTDFHMQGIQNRIDAFRQFAAEHPDRMKQPGVTKGI